MNKAGAQGLFSIKQLGFTAASAVPWAQNVPQPYLGRTALPQVPRHPFPCPPRVKTHLRYYLINVCVLRRVRSSQRGTMPALPATGNASSRRAHSVCGMPQVWKEGGRKVGWRNSCRGKDAPSKPETALPTPNQRTNGISESRLVPWLSNFPQGSRHLVKHLDVLLQRLWWPRPGSSCPGTPV